MSFSFKYGIDVEVYKNDDWMLEQEACSVYQNRHHMHSDTSNRMTSLACSGLKMEEEHLNI